ncbi:uncharacterized protein LOC135127758 [Zophobas morio]|uniref:uncharacterized protein LOC135127758 n=1 Tax=Zophobas morio TaxID=2755281 RepID=UPI003083BD95
MECVHFKSNSSFNKVYRNCAIPSIGERKSLQGFFINIDPTTAINIKIGTNVRNVKQSQVRKVCTESSNIVEKTTKYYGSESTEEHIHTEESIKGYWNEAHSTPSPKLEVKSKIVRPLSILKINHPPSQLLEIIPTKKVTAEEDFYKDCLYDADYFEENFKYILEREKYFVFRKGFLHETFDVKRRMIMVNYLSDVQSQFNLSPPAFFVGIRMFDCMLATGTIPSDIYDVMGITCLWLANKHFEVDIVEVSQLIRLLNGKYSKEYIFLAEQMILKLLHFDTNIVEPTSFLFYFLCNEKLETDCKILYSAMFLLEMFTLLIDFSSLKPSELACISLYLVLRKYEYNLQCVSLLNYIDEVLLDKETFLIKSYELRYSLERLLHHRAAEPVVKKYSSAKMYFVAKNFIFG